jgi:hypothetical protein
MCNNFKAWTWDNSSYNYIWNGDCTAGDCWFHIFNWAFESHAITEPTTLPEPVGLLWVEAFAQLPADFPETTEPNPYVEPLELWIDEVLVIYKALGKNRTMATCRFNPGPGEVRFFSEPNTQ